MNVAVVGGGSLGMLFAVHLQRIQHKRLVLYTRTQQQASDINRRGITFTSTLGETLSVPMNAKSWTKRRGDVWDLLLLTVKQTHLTSAFIEDLAQLITRDTFVLCFQNGLGHLEKLQSKIKKGKWFTAVTTEAALKTNMAEVSHTGTGKTIIGNDEGGHLSSVVDLLTAAGFSVELSNHIESIIWDKLLINAVINPLTAMLRVRNGELSKRSEWRNLMRTLLEEGLSVSRKLQIKTADHLFDQLLSVCKQTANNQSSMLQDVLAGRQTEIDYINGSIVRLAQQLNVKVPVQHAVWRMVKGLEMTE